ncbi:hypothetical protein V8G61_10290 [Gaetbulibacter sp. M240]|uniref:hypothetical protein n=1 Tax=Gaetbulibacter sp. M240 TaxID=3126511 RepID=UPI00374FAD0E
MKIIFSFILCLLTQQLISQVQINNKSIIEMHELGLDSTIIISKINSSDCNFNTDTDDLLKLTEKNIPSNVISAMIEYRKKRKEVGIFYNTVEGLKKIEANSFISTSTDATASAFTMGLANSKIKARLEGEVSNNKVSFKKQEFVFQFDNSNNEINQFNWWFYTVNSPESFSLIEFKNPDPRKVSNRRPRKGETNIQSISEKTKKRELVIGKVGFANYKMGVDEKELIPFSFEKIGDNRFKITPKKPLELGEYCFIMKGTYAGYTNQSVFDFSIVED